MQVLSNLPEVSVSQVSQLLACRRQRGSSHTGVGVKQENVTGTKMCMYSAILWNETSNDLPHTLTQNEVTKQLLPATDGGWRLNCSIDLHKLIDVDSLLLGHTHLHLF